jgi:serine/threonine-protein kinase
MAPEQVAGDPLLYHRADLYSFGVLAFELCTGRPVFAGTPSEILRQHLAASPPALGELRADLPARLVAMVHACLEKDPASRPADAAVILDMLDGATALSSNSLTAQKADRRGDDNSSGTSRGMRKRSRWSEALIVPAAYLSAAGPAVAYLLHLAETDRVREGIAAAGVMGALLGLPLAIAGGLILRLMGRERVTAS